MPMGRMVLSYRAVSHHPHVTTCCPLNATDDTVRPSGLHQKAQAHYGTGGTAASPPEGEEARHVPTFRFSASRSSIPDTAHIVRSSCSNCVSQRRCIRCCA